MDLYKLKKCKTGKIRLLFCVLVLLPFTINAQQLPPKEVKHFTQFWTSINTTARISDKWYVLGDFHIRRNNFLKDPGFYVLRGALNYKLRPNLAVAAGYAHLWLAASYKDEGYYLDENRIYEQAILTHSTGKFKITHRLRNEQRWIEYTIKDSASGNFRFTNRIRYLFSMRIPVSKNPKFPQIVLADEIMVHFGKSVNYSNFEQNRIFAGIYQPISKTVSFDLGYMYTYQLRTSGYQYNVNNTIRLFFYYTPDWRKHKPVEQNVHHQEND
jgi:Protein of unknown function (DUF2490)